MPLTSASTSEPQLIAHSGQHESSKEYFQGLLSSGRFRPLHMTGPRKLLFENG